MLELTSQGKMNLYKMLVFCKKFWRILCAPKLFHNPSSLMVVTTAQKK